MGEVDFVDQAAALGHRGSPVTADVRELLRAIGRVCDTGLLDFSGKRRTLDVSRRESIATLFGLTLPTKR
ncbi:hypothetical protein D3C76_1076430 [compost metagenome]